MRVTRSALVLLLAVLLLALVAAEALAVPLFARKYGFVCTMCHTTFPNLNDFGQKFRMNAYSIPGSEDQEKTVLESGAPFAARTMAGFTSDKFAPGGGDVEVSQFRLNGLDLFAAGLIGGRKGFFVGYKPSISGSSGVDAQEGALEQASVAFSQLAGTWLNARVGRFEAAYVPFSQLRSITMAPYEIYNFDGSPAALEPGLRGSRNTFMLAETADGLEITGYGPHSFQYAVGLTNGSRSNRSSDGASDVYARAAYVFGEGLGQVAGQRVGVTGYFGQARGEGLTDRNSFARLGVDASLNTGPFSAWVQWVQGWDNGAFNIAAPGDQYKFSGGFVQLNHVTGASTKFVRYDWVDTPATDNHDIARWTLGWRHPMGDNLALQLEYSNRRVQNGVLPSGCLSENFATARLDWAF